MSKVGEHFLHCLLQKPPIIVYFLIHMGGFKRIYYRLSIESFIIAGGGMDLISKVLCSISCPDLPVWVSVPQ